MHLNQPFLAPTEPLRSVPPRTQVEARGVWSIDEHQRFVEGIRQHPSGPWKDIAAHVGTRTARQTMTHAQKYRLKIVRRLKAMRSDQETPTKESTKGSRGIHSPRFNPLLSSDEQVNDSIHSTTLAIAAENEMDQIHDAWVSSHAHHTVEVKDKIETMEDDRPMRIDAENTTLPVMEANGNNDEDIDFDYCMDFLIEKLHSSPQSLVP